MSLRKTLLVTAECLLRAVEMHNLYRSIAGKHSFNVIISFIQASHLHVGTFTRTKDNISKTYIYAHVHAHTHACILPSVFFMALEVKVNVIDQEAEESSIQSFGQEVSVMVGHFNGVAPCYDIT